MFKSLSYLLCLFFVFCNLSYAVDPGIPFDPDIGDVKAPKLGEELAGRKKEVSYYKAQPHFIHIGTIETGPGVLEEVIATQYDILPDHADLAKHGGKEVTLEKTLSFNVKYDDKDSLYTLRELLAQPSVKKIPTQVGKVDLRIFQGKEKVSLISTGHVPPSPDLSVDTSISEHEFVTRYTLAPDSKFHTQHLLSHQIQFARGKPNEIVKHKLCIEYETWVPEKSADHALVWKRVQVSGYLVKKITLTGEKRLLIYNVGNFRRGIFAFNDSTNLTTDGIPIKYRIIPVVHTRGIGWRDDTTRRQIVITLK